MSAAESNQFSCLQNFHFVTTLLYHFSARSFDWGPTKGRRNENSWGRKKRKNKGRTETTGRGGEAEENKGRRRKEKERTRGITKKVRKMIWHIVTGIQRDVKGLSMSVQKHVNYKQVQVPLRSLIMDTYPHPTPIYKRPQNQKNVTTFGKIGSQCKTSYI